MIPLDGCGTARRTDPLPPCPAVESHVARCFARPAWERTLALTAARLGVPVETIR